ncbi:MAG: TIGR00730 family Rossman fold protein [Bacteroidota bacterium]
MADIQQIAVYCASSSRVDPIYLEAAWQTGKELALAPLKVAYGGGAVGLMGRLADSVVAHGGEITGIMPQYMKEAELQHPQVEDFIFVDDLRDRKKMLLQKSKAAIALPGGCGTMDELMEALTLKRLGRFNHPIIILNTQSYFDPLITMLEKSVAHRFMKEEHLDLWTAVAHPHEIVPAIQNSGTWQFDPSFFTERD